MSSRFLRYDLSQNLEPEQHEHGPAVVFQRISFINVLRDMRAFSQEKRLRFSEVLGIGRWRRREGRHSWDLGGATLRV